MKNKEITVYELMELIKDNKAPKKIKYDGIELTYSTLKEDYMGYYSNGNGDYLLQYLFDKCRNTSHFINDAVEILPEEDEWEDIPIFKISDYEETFNQFQLDVVKQINLIKKNQKYLKERLDQYGK